MLRRGLFIGALPPFLRNPRRASLKPISNQLRKIDPRAVAYGALVLTAALWGSSVVTARGLMDSLPPVTLAYLRWSVVLLALAPFAWPERADMVKALRTHFQTYATLAVVGFAPQTCLVYFGLIGSTATLLGLLNSAIPVMIVALMAALNQIGRASCRERVWIPV